MNLSLNESRLSCPFGHLEAGITITLLSEREPALMPIRAYFVAFSYTFKSEREPALMPIRALLLIPSETTRSEREPALMPIRANESV